MNRRGPYYFNLLRGLDYGIATIFGIPAGVYISAYVHMKDWKKCEAVLNWLFTDSEHCVNAYKANLQDIQYYYGGN